jgi:hypothetical protein
MAIVRQVLAAVLLGLLVRAWRGFSMLDPFFFIPFACLSVVLAGPMFVDLRRKDQSGPLLRQLTRAVVLACGSVGIMLAVPLVTLNYPWSETWLLPQWPTAIDAVLLSLAGATGAAAATGLLLVRLPAVAVKWALRVLVLSGLIAWRFAPGDWGNSAIVKVMDWGISKTALSIAAALVMADAVLLYLLVRHNTAVAISAPQPGR